MKRLCSQVPVGGKADDAASRVEHAVRAPGAGRRQGLGVREVPRGHGVHVPAGGTSQRTRLRSVWVTASRG
jgi:hypothetical protein